MLSHPHREHQAEIHWGLVGNSLLELQHELELRVGAPKLNLPVRPAGAPARAHALFKPTKPGEETKPTSEKEENNKQKPRRLRPAGPSKE